MKLFFNSLKQSEKKFLLRNAVVYFVQIDIFVWRGRIPEVSLFSVLALFRRAFRSLALLLHIVEAALDAAVVAIVFHEVLPPVLPDIVL